MGVHPRASSHASSAFHLAGSALNTAEMRCAALAADALLQTHSSFRTPQGQRTVTDLPQGKASSQLPRWQTPPHK